MYSKKIDSQTPNCEICIEPIKFYGLGSCEHKYICHVCIYKIRILQKNNQCPVCKTTQFNLIITDNLDLKYKTSSPTKQDHEIIYTVKEAEQAMKDLAAIMCSVRHCQSDERFQNQSGLKKHLMQSHQLYFCDICLAYKMCSLSEQILYTKDQLDQHTRNGDINESNEVVFFHPFCKFCSRTFFDDDQMLSHLNHSHERCNICKDQIYKYYENYQSLQKHYRKSHFICEEQSCLDKQFIAFELQKELDLHKMTVHDKQTKVTNQLLNQLVGFYSQNEQKQSFAPKLLKMQDKEGFDFQFQLLTVFKNKNKGFKISSNTEGDQINILDIYGVQYDQWRVLKRQKNLDNEEVFMEDLILFKKIPNQNYADFFYRAGQVLSKEEVNQLSLLFNSYKQNQGSDKKFLEEVLKLCGMKTGLDLFQFLLATIQDNNSHYALKNLYLQKIANIKSKNQNLLNECKSYLELLKLVLENIEVSVLNLLKLKLLQPNQHYLDKDRVKQQQQILKSFGNQDKYNMKLAANFAIEHKSINLIKQMILIPKSEIQVYLKQLENYQLLMVYVFFLIANGYIYFDLVDNLKYNLFEPLIEKKKQSTKNEKQIAQIQIDKEQKQIKAQKQKEQDQQDKELKEIQFNKVQAQIKYDQQQVQIRADQKAAQLQYQKDQKEKKEELKRQEKQLLQDQQQEKLLKKQQEEQDLKEKKRMEEQEQDKQLQLYHEQIRMAEKISQDEYNQQMLRPKKEKKQFYEESVEESKTQSINDMYQSQITAQDYGCWEQDTNMINKNTLNKQEIGRIKKKGKTQKVFLSGSFK